MDIGCCVPTRHNPLIEPYGIEITFVQTSKRVEHTPLIEPYGIEIRWQRPRILPWHNPLIEPYGIEIKDLQKEITITQFL